jgi:hypothetical protein
VATNRIFVDPGPSEACTLDSTGYYFADRTLLDWTSTSAPSFKKVETNYDPPSQQPTQNQYNRPLLYNIGANEGRLRSDLRAAAVAGNPIADLCKSAAAFEKGNSVEGNAFADLSVTGQRAFAAFKARPPQEADILACLPTPPVHSVLDAARRKAVGQALDRAYTVLRLLRAGGWPKANLKSRDSLGYVAVSGEDDQPHRPVNVGSAEFPQYDLTVNVLRPGGATLAVHTRYMIAHTVAPRRPQRPGELKDKLESAAVSTTIDRTVPQDEPPLLASDAEVILYMLAYARLGAVTIDYLADDKVGLPD